MTLLPFYWIDAFTDRAFGGNPAAVCPLETWLPDALLQRMAWQHGLSETAFCVPAGEGRFELRWFTPAVEVDLCGHATLATAHVLFNEHRIGRDRLTFLTQSGELTVARSEGGRLELDFPSRPAAPVADDEATQALLAALGVRSATWVGQSRDFMVVLHDEAAVVALEPDFVALARCDTFAVIATAAGDDCDFVSRFFTPRGGIDEDPVTGSAHCTLVPYWAERLGKNRLHARQRSSRGGELWCELRDDRVGLAGHAVTYLRGELTI